MALSSLPLLLDPIQLLTDFETFVPSREELLRRLTDNVDVQHAAKSQPMRELNVDLPLSVEQAARGGVVPIEFPIARLCPRCDGSGSTGFYACDLCDGHGLDWRDARVEVVVPQQARDGMVMEIPLTELGVRNFFLRLFVRVGRHA
jgi:DnaJ-class molecular chaperone